MPARGKVRFRPLARRDLLVIHDYVANAAGPALAGRCLDRIEQAFLALADFPERGTLKAAFGPGLRTIGFERRATIAFRVTGDDVQIVRILYAGRDVEGALREMLIDED
ncbi:type II toxin-antitoxin system RelE/ParE family toxin [Phenylobacterium sp.]|uniref:type II toxin-antitoxin system RelE/ParE family toxin n=1 Tax=Phenylobacterium sp. TaxID=1871053 RepID=UPI0025F7F74A|nr:type II toxin-antitoxin system RelE/ParE family toxin [Phenylobacterium sp.]